MTRIYAIDQGFLSTEGIADAVRRVSDSSDFTRAFSDFFAEVMLIVGMRAITLVFERGQLAEVREGRSRAPFATLSGSQVGWKRALKLAPDVPASADPKRGGLVLQGDEFELASRSMALHVLWLALRDAANCLTPLEPLTHDPEFDIQSEIVVDILTFQVSVFITRVSGKVPL